MFLFLVSLVGDGIHQFLDCLFVGKEVVFLEFHIVIELKYIRNSRRKVEADDVLVGYVFQDLDDAPQAVRDLEKYPEEYMKITVVF